MIEYYSLGRVSVFHTFNHETGKTMESPVFYVDNES